MRSLSCLLFRSWQLRVVANSDSPRDQRDKIRVRDAALQIARRCPLCLGRMTAAARAIDPSARARLVLYPPHAPHPTVLLTLGKGEGHNWLGMLFPELFGLVSSEPVVFRSFLLEQIRRWFF